VKSFVASILVGSFMLVGVLPAATSRSISSDTPIQLAAGSDSTTDKDTYTQKARDDLQEWQRKLHDFSEKAETAGRRDASEAEHDLNAAWKKTQGELRQLQAASSEDWEAAKSSYEKASHELADTWHRIVGGDK
jgi:hypothetical protein